MSQMTEIESMERVSEGLRKAMSCAKQLGALQKSPSWAAVGKELERLLKATTVLYEQESVTHAEAVDMLDRMVANRIIAEASNKVQ